MDENHACSIKIQYLVKLIDLLSFLVLELFLFPTLQWNESLHPTAHEKLFGIVFIPAFSCLLKICL